MKLAEALLLRADIQKKLESLKDRISKNTVVQEGEKPSENPIDLLKQSIAIIEHLRILILSINEANLRGQTNRNRSLTAALAERDSLIYRHSLVQSAANSATKPPERYGVKEIRWIKTVDVSALQKDADDLAKKIRDINAEIQSANWAIDIENF